MSRNRIAPKSELQKGPNGRNLCRGGCGSECQPPRRTFCSDECVHRYRLRRDPGYCRALVWKRDHGACALCGVDAQAIAGQLRSARREEREAAIRRLADRGWPERMLRRRLWDSLWDADHIVPVCEGGGECGLENYQTLCLKCHHEKTVTMRRRARKGRGTLPIEEGPNEGTHDG